MKIKIEASGRTMAEQLNSQLRDFPHARNAAVAVWNECYRDQGSDHLFGAEVTHEPDQELLAVKIHALESAPAPVMNAGDGA